MDRLTFDFSSLFPEPRPANEGREEERRCLAVRKDGEPCRAWASWDSPEQFCAVHLHPVRRKRREMTDEIREESRRRHSPVCDCPAYNWPHREYNGLCRGPEGPLETWPTPTGKRRPGQKRRREVRALLRKYGLSLG
jgi:hypothetical protein